MKRRVLVLSLLLIGLGLVVLGLAWDHLVPSSAYWGPEQANELTAAHTDMHSKSHHHGADAEQQMATARERYEKISQQLESARGSQKRYRNIFPGSRSFTPRCGNCAPRLAKSIRIGSADHHDLAAESATADSPWRTCSARFGQGASIRKRSIIGRPKKSGGLPPPPEPTPPPCDIEQIAVFLYSCRFTSRQTSRSEASEHRDQPFDRPAWGHVS